MTETGRLPPPLPPRLDWFVHTQMEQLARDGVPAWFHGDISREAQGCCRHFMIKVLDNGSFLILGETVTHATLDALVTYHQQKPVRPHDTLLTQPCGQKDPTNVDYEDLFLYSNALLEEAASPRSSPGPSPREHQRPASCLVTSSEQASPKPGLLHWAKDRKLSAPMHHVTTEEATSSYPQKSPLVEARQKLWRNLKTLPKTGKKVQQQLKSHLAAVSLPSLWDAGRLAGTPGSGARTGSQEHSGETAWKENIYHDPFMATSLKSTSQPQSLRDRATSSRKTVRPANQSSPGGAVTPGDRSWHRAAARAQSSPVYTPEPSGLSESPEDWLPEEYNPPPPFAPGYS
ncbi:hematopoietic SH2 domain-containing protein isoform X2 [Tupaia chinensis]|uniref:hematopoietic SH2 domain-containing protein isoform X2 n=1 Tax=Tupaia chinensis TaxID=246437 RepID=UPI000FFC8C7D|nr:hematopoietic SH2 domain-containing protein isoform X2 [Tupaia chinensis]